jgi:two-component system sensor histidine kinase DctS
MFERISKYLRAPFYLWLPKLSVALLVLAVLSLLWVLHLNEQEEQRNTLISDVLWLEQNLRFQLNGTVEQLDQLVQDLAHQRKPADRQRLLSLRSAHLLKNRPELSQLHLMGPGEYGASSDPFLLPDEQRSQLKSALTIASHLHRPQFTEPFITSEHKPIVLLGIGAGGVRGEDIQLVASLSLEALLQDAVPWWFAQKYQVRLVNDAGLEFARKSNVDPGNTPGASYDLVLDTPGYGLRLSVTAYQSGSNTEQRVLAIAIILLSISVFISLWVIRHQMRRRQNTEEALRAEYAFRESMENSLTVGMRARDLNGRMIYVNPAFCRMTGFSKEALIGCMPPMPYWLADHMEATYTLHWAVLSGQAPQDGFEIELGRKNGEVFRALIYEAPLIDGKGQHIGWMGSVLDVTERHKAQELANQQMEKLQATSRLVTMGEMASTLAHELNQPLAAITSYNSGCLNVLPDEGVVSNETILKVKGALEKLGLQAQRAGRIIRRVHDFVKKREPQRAPCSLPEIIEDTLGFSEAQARNYEVTIESRVPTEVPLIDADKVMVEQVLVNLIRNGLEAMTQTPVADRQLVVSVDIGEKYVTVRVRDTGVGIADEVMAKLFTAFFTTKLDGLGIGLSICRSIIEFHQGQLWVEKPDIGQGTVFGFTLPLIQGSESK